MKKNIFLILLLVMFTSINNLEAGHNADEWAFIDSPLKSTGAKVYLKGNKDSKDVIINVERSLASTDYQLERFFNIAVDMISMSRSDAPDYEVDYYQLLVMLAIAGQTDYKWQTNAGLFTSAWWINYVSLDSIDDILKTCIDDFKKQFPVCKRIKLQCDSLYQEVVLRKSDEMDGLTDYIRDNGLELILDAVKLD